MERNCGVAITKALLGKNILKSELTFDLEIFVSPGGYICGEETALIEAIEGKRAEPRNKPPFPVQAGLWQKPTVLNNVETFANVPQILARGVEASIAHVGSVHRAVSFNVRWCRTTTQTAPARATPRAHDSPHPSWARVQLARCLMAVTSKCRPFRSFPG